MEDKTVEMAMLFDFFGELLTDRQKDCFELYYSDDLSLGEIAEEMGISRQGVRDNLVRAEHALREYEARTGVVRRFEERRREVEKLEEGLRRLSELLGDGEARTLAQTLLRSAEELKG